MKTVEEFNSDRKKLIHNYVLVSQISSLYDNSNKWKQTTLEHIKQMVLNINNVNNCDANGTPIFDENKFSDGVLEAKDERGRLPLTYAIINGAKLEVVVWIISIIGIQAAVAWRGKINETHLHYAKARNQPHLLPYLLLLFGVDSLAIMDDVSDGTPVQWAERGKNKACVEYLDDCYKTIEEFDVKYSGSGKEVSASQIESLEVESLHEFSGRWSVTQMLTVENLEKEDIGQVCREDKYGYLPIVYAGWHGASLHTFTWLCENTFKKSGISMYKSAFEGNVIKAWHDSEGWNILHYLAFFNQPHLIPYMLFLYLDAASERDYLYSKTTLEFVELALSRETGKAGGIIDEERDEKLKKRKKCLSLLRGPESAVQEYCLANCIDYDTHLEKLEEAKESAAKKKAFMLRRRQLQKERIEDEATDGLASFSSP